MIATVIMAGGKGERFWPKSRKKLPKQLLSLTDDGRTMIQLTYDRMKKIVNSDNMYVVTGEEYASIISHQLNEIPTSNILVEPMGRNTAACIGLSAIHVAKNNPEAVMVILPSDHLIKDSDEFLSVVKTAVEIAEKGENIVTIGITPTYAETGYGYINYNEIAENVNGHDILKVNKFVEKPNYDKAIEYLESGKYLWNSGMFVWKASTILKNIEKYMPRLFEALTKISNAMDTEQSEEVLNSEYSLLESISVDYGIMEHAKPIFMIPGDFGWDDLGAWTSLERIRTVDSLGNVTKGNVVSVDTKKCIIEGADKLIATVGVEDLIIVDTDDATLICHKDKSQDVKELLIKMKELNKETYL